MSGFGAIDCVHCHSASVVALDCAGADRDVVARHGAQRRRVARVYRNAAFAHTHTECSFDVAHLELRAVIGGNAGGRHDLDTWMRTRRGNACVDVNLPGEHAHARSRFEQNFRALRQP